MKIFELLVLYLSYFEILAYRELFGQILCKKKNTCSVEKNTGVH